MQIRTKSFQPACQCVGSSITAYPKCNAFWEAARQRGNFPWQVLLLTDQWIMTAAHNIYLNHKEQRDNLQDLAPSSQIHLGDTNVEILTFMPRLEIEGIFVLPGFQKGALQFNNDIELIKLWHHVTVNETLMLLSLPADDSLYQPRVMGYVSDWGITEGNKLSNQLKNVAFPVVDLCQCSASINSQRSHRIVDIPHLTDNMFCAGRVEGGEDTCLGDSEGVFTLLRGG
ncbi:complement C1r-A subcomponent-like [Polyodon spathula]|uniref:complement C1r-A subcomponent-like n=1 Tax=Polyodon spathula TaxID=7913 RepID=UPI001B7E19D4|nr:complement C1r-A subcomponent-like [Polyodon spathula]